MITTIAEMGINHHGEMDIACMSIDKAKECGADIWKTQSYDPVSILGIDSPYLAEASKAQFSRHQHKDLKAYCDKAGIEYCCSVFHAKDVEFFEDIGMKRYKVASRAAKDKELLERIAATGKPAIVSTGFCIPDDIDYVKTLFKDLTLLYCVCKYPARLQDIDINCMSLLKSWGTAIGFSSHCPHISPTIAAICAGATTVENHVVLQGYETGCDASSSLDFKTFGQLIKLIREWERMHD